MATVIRSIGSGKTYSTIATWIVSLSDGTYSSGDDIVGELYDSSYDETFNIGDAPFSTGSLNSVTLRANSEYKHDGTPDSGVRIVYSGSVSDGSAPYIVSYDSSTYGDYKVKIEDIEFADFNHDTDVHAYGFLLSEKTTVMSRCLVNNFSSAAGPTKSFRVFRHGKPRIQNCMVFNCGKLTGAGGVSANVQAFNLDNDGAAKVYNCTVYNIFDSSANTVWGAFYGEYVNTIIVDAGVCFRLVSGSGSSNNISSDSTAPGANSIIAKLAVSLFASTIQGSEDLHLIALSPALRKGTDLGTLYDIQYDIDAYDRDASVSAWDVGADQCDICKTTPSRVNSKLSLGFSVNQAVSSFNLSDF
tara:strand:+ start:628 stop:1701 length:1074 start_codon:yes stop_codon:yes gene_type:complete